VHPVSIQTGSHPVEQHESIALPRMAPAPDLEPFGLINFTDSSPPFEQRITKHTTGRAPPLA
jgi:hypothetical protein